MSEHSSSQICVSLCLQSRKTFNVLKKMIAGRQPLMASVVMIIMMKVLSGLTLTCHPAEYQIGNKCCPKCPAGSQVKTHCTKMRSTYCLPCLDGTYMDKLNGPMEQCAPCTNCDSDSGLQIKRRCTGTSDTVCEPMEGFYCVDPSGDDCGASQKYKRCDPGQYISQKGTVVRRDCTAQLGTQCAPCEQGTFMNQPNGLYSCLSCTSCDPGHGLITKQRCTSTADTVCDVGSGYYCTSVTSSNGCSLAEKQSQCVAGQRIKEPGTSRSDTVCEDCQSGFFSQDGVNCTAWTICPETHQKVKEGNSTSDVVCGSTSRHHYALIAPVILIIFLSVAFVIAGKILQNNCCSFYQ